MRISLQKTLANKHSLRINSILIGFLLWSILGSMHSTTITVQVPLCFYDGQQNTVTLTDAPEFITITLKGARSDLRAIDFNNLAVHVDTENFKKNKNGIILTNKNLFLPKQVKLVHYSPMNLMLTKEAA